MNSWQFMQSITSNLQLLSQNYKTLEFHINRMLLLFYALTIKYKTWTAIKTSSFSVKYCKVETIIIIIMQQVLKMPLGAKSSKFRNSSICHWSVTMSPTMWQIRKSLTLFKVWKWAGSSPECRGWCQWVTKSFGWNNPVQNRSGDSVRNPEWGDDLPQKEP